MHLKVTMAFIFNAWKIVNTFAVVILASSFFHFADESGYYWWVFIIYQTLDTMYSTEHIESCLFKKYIVRHMRESGNLILVKNKEHLGQHSMLVEVQGTPAFRRECCVSIPGLFVSPPTLGLPTAYPVA